MYYIFREIGNEEVDEVKEEKGKIEGRRGRKRDCRG